MPTIPPERSSRCASSANRTRESIQAAAAGVRWLVGVQNRDGGVPTFCRGWGTLPFDRSTPEITAHALRAWSAWHTHLDVPLQQATRHSASRAMSYLERTQRGDGSWIPLWFGNEDAPGEDNPVYGTARVLLALDGSLIREDSRADKCRRRAVRWLLDVQNDDGGWGGNDGVSPSAEETGIALSALGQVSSGVRDERVVKAIEAGVHWLCAAAANVERPATPLGLYFARFVVLRRAVSVDLRSGRTGQRAGPVRARCFRAFRARALGNGAWVSSCLNPASRDLTRRQRGSQLPTRPRFIAKDAALARRAGTGQFAERSVPSPSSTKRCLVRYTVDVPTPTVARDQVVGGSGRPRRGDLRPVHLRTGPWPLPGASAAGDVLPPPA